MTLESLVNISSAVIALAALIFAIVSFKRQQDRADLQARASVKPLLAIKSQTYIDLKSIRIVNFGLGPAIIKRAEFRRSPEGIPTNKIINLFDLDIIWESFVNVPPNRAIPAQGEIVLIKQSLDHLKRQKKIDQNAALAILAQWQQQKTGILVRIEYEDIFGNPLPALEETLS